MIFNYVILKVQGSSPIGDGYSSLTVQLPLKSEKYCHQKCPDVPDLDHMVSELLVLTLYYINGQDLERLDIFGDGIFHFLGVIVLLVSYSHPL